MTHEPSTGNTASGFGLGLFLTISGIVTAYSGLFAWSGIMMLIGVAVTVTGLYVTLVNGLRWFLRRR